MPDGILILIRLLPGLLLVLAGFIFHRLLGALAGKDPVPRYRRLRALLAIYGIVLVTLAVMAVLWLRELDHPDGLGLWELACLACILIGFGSVVFHFLQAWKKFRGLPKMTRQNSRRATPAFFWQGVLIMLPVAVLAVASLVSLRQDERAAENDARNRAGENARSLGRAMRATVDEELRRFVSLQNTWVTELLLASQPNSSGDIFPDPALKANIEKWEHDHPGLSFAALVIPNGEILADGRQIEPPDFPAAPRPPKWFRDLSPEQAKLWDSLRRAGDQMKRNSRWQAFRNSNPGQDAQQAAQDLMQAPEQVAEYGGALPSETGISFEEIACCHLLMATNAQLTDRLLQSVWERVMGHPSILSPKLMELAGSLTNRANPVLQQKFYWMRIFFDGRSKAGECLGSLRRLPDLQPWEKLFWSHWTEDGSVLAFFQAATYLNPGNDSEGVSLAGRGYEVWLVPRAVVEMIFDRALAEDQSFVPPYATPEVTVEGVRLHPAHETAAVDEHSVLAGVEQKAGSYFAPDSIRFEVKFFLTSRARMLDAERKRAKIFGALILASALTALAGLASARRAFRRQLQLNEQKSNFVSSVSHELRAPIASVRLMAENLERGKISEPARQGEYFRFIVQECRRLSSLIENVLDFSRIEQGRKQYEFEPTNLVALVETTVKLMEPYAAEKGVRLEFHPELQIPNSELALDGRAIQQALVNLIDNAVKHSPKGETVTVGIESGAGGTAVLLYVADHGPGIPLKEHEKIFERFYRLGSELRRETQGVGIGLSVVKHIVEAHGGHVRVQSDVGKGSRFTIELPMKHNE
jgi:signal transduction histidine kinase